MTPEEFITYFETAATNNREIGHIPGNAAEKHFYRCDIVELLTDMRSIFNKHALILEHAEDIAVDLVSDNERVNQECGFMIIATVNGREDLVAVREKRDWCYRVAWQIISKMRNDCRKNIFTGINFSSIRVQAWYNDDSTVVGYRVTFIYEDVAPVEFNTTDWTNETPWNF